MPRTFVTPHRSRSLAGFGYLLVGIGTVFAPWFAFSWSLMLFIGNLHHAGAGIDPLSYGATLWLWAPFYFPLAISALFAIRR